MASESDHSKDGKSKPAQGADPLKLIADFAGQAVNSALSVVTGFDAKTLVAQLSPESIVSYMRGKNIDPNDANLNAQQKADLKIYSSLHDSLTASIPFYDHTAFVKSMEQEISERSKQQDIVDFKRLGTETSNPRTSDSSKLQDSGQCPVEDKGFQISAEKQPPTNLPSSDNLGNPTQAQSQSHNEANSSNPISTTNDHKLAQPKQQSSELDKLIENRNSSSRSSSSDLLADPSHIVKPFKSIELQEVNSQKGTNREASGGKIEHAEFGSQKSNPITWDNVVKNNAQSPETSASAPQYSMPDQSKAERLNSIPKSLNASDSVQSITRDKGTLRSAVNRDSDSHPTQLPPKDSLIKVSSSQEQSDCKFSIQNTRQAEPHDNIPAWQQPRLTKDKDLPGSDQKNSLSSTHLGSPNSKPDRVTQPIEKNQPLTVHFQNTNHSSDVMDSGSTREFATKPLSEGTIDQIKLSSGPQKATQESTSGPNEIKRAWRNEGVDQNSHIAVPQTNLPKIHDSITTKLSAASLSDLKANKQDNLGVPSKLRESAESFMHLLNTHGISELRWQSALNHSHSEFSKVFTYRSTGNWSTQPTPLRSDGSPEGRTSVTSGPKVAVTTGNRSAGSSIGNINDTSTELTSLAGMDKRRFNPNNKRYILGSEIALAIIIAAAGATRIRTSVSNVGPNIELIPGTKPTDSSTVDTKQGNLVQDGASSQQAEIKNRPIEKFTCSQEFIGKTFISGAEIALAVIIGRMGTNRIRANFSPANTSVFEQSHCITSAVNQIADPPIYELAAKSTTKDEHQEKTSRAMDNDTESSDQRRVKPKQKKKLANPAIIRPKTLVASTDTLISIAEAFFYDRNVAWLIADLNQSTLKETWMDGKRIIELKSRQQIELPVWDDIDKFYSSRPKYARPENLITIVDQSTIDSELLNSTLRKLLDPNQD